MRCAALALVRPARALNACGELLPLLGQSSEFSEVALAAPREGRVRRLGVLGLGLGVCVGGWVVKGSQGRVIRG